MHLLSESENKNFAGMEQTFAQLPLTRAYI